MSTSANPHPKARCEYCGATKWNVDWEACSQLCAEILGYSANGLPSATDKMVGDMRAAGVPAVVYGGWVGGGGA